MRKRHDIEHRKSAVPDAKPEICLLCGRKLAPPCTKHHLLPVSKGGKGTKTVLLHKICHDKIHRVLSEKELKKYYHTMDRILEVPAIVEFVQWVRKKEPGYFDISNRSKA